MSKYRLKRVTLEPIGKRKPRRLWALYGPPGRLLWYFDSWTKWEDVCRTVGWWVDAPPHGR